jgi:hypothetical protein
MPLISRPRARNSRTVSPADAGLRAGGRLVAVDRDREAVERERAVVERDALDGRRAALPERGRAGALVAICRR